jgi:Tol biopolymer transport system component
MFPVKPGGALLCSRMPSSLCVIAEPSDDGSRFTLTAIDPNLGRGPELTRLALEPGEDLQAIDLSPDGRLLAVLTNSDGPIKLFSRQGRTMGTIRPRGLTRIQFIHWAANGRGIYVTTGEGGGLVLWHVDLRGSRRQIWKNRGGNWALGLPSPNGRYLAIESSDNSQNMWMMEKF